jgi:putative toxin-antitoxin system antitoxin component (TIGR02293 family)
LTAKRTRRRHADKTPPSLADGSGREDHITRVQALANNTFGDKEKASLWLRRPLQVLGDQAPIVLAETEWGARIVEGLLHKIAWGAPT